MTPKREPGWLRRLAPVLMAISAGSLAWMLISAAGVQPQHAGAATPTPDGPDATNRGRDESDLRPSPTPTPLATPRPAATLTPRKRVVVLDPGHGGAEVGAADYGVVEKVSNLEMALRVEALLRARGIEVVLTRRSDERAVSSEPGWTAQHFDLQGRIDIANAARLTSSSRFTPAASRVEGSTASKSGPTQHRRAGWRITGSHCSSRSGCWPSYTPEATRPPTAGCTTRVAGPCGPAIATTCS
jgi:hypothetical protein